MTMNPLAPYVQHLPECSKDKLDGVNYDLRRGTVCTCGLSQALESQEAGLMDEEIERLATEQYKEAGWLTGTLHWKREMDQYRYEGYVAALRYLRERLTKLMQP